MIEAADMTGAGQTAESAVERVIDFVKQGLLAGDLNPGDRLPPERDLAMRLGVSRPSLREGLRALSLLGLIDIRHGQGTFVRHPDLAILRDVTTMTLAHVQGALAETMQARIAIECQAIRLACQRAQDGELQRIERQLERLVETLSDPEAGGLADQEFHRLIVEASHCAPLITMYDALLDLLRPLHVERRQTTIHIDGIRNYLVDAHREILVALLHRDPARADLQLRAHFEIGEEFRRKGVATELARRFASTPARPA